MMMSEINVPTIELTLSINARSKLFSKLFSPFASTKSISSDCDAAPHVVPSKPPQLPSPMSGRNVTTPAPPVEQPHGSPLRMIA